MDSIVIKKERWDPEVPLLGISPGEMKTSVHTELVHECPFAAALVIRAPNWKHFQSLSTDKWMDKT